MIVTGDNKKANHFGEFLVTEMGNIEIKEHLNILGLRVDNKMSFAKQYSHLMSKVGNLRRDTLELIGMGTNKQILSNAFARSNGIYLYGIGIQRKWKQSQYRRAQREVNDLIRMVYNIKWKRENSWSQRDLLRLANWPPVRIQHEMAALLFLNKITMSNIEYLYEITNHHLRFANGKRVLDIPYAVREKNFLEDPISEDWVPNVVLNKEDKRKYGKRAKLVYPLSTMQWFNSLPNFIKYRIGTKSFEQAIHGWFHIQCWCRSASKCSKCQKRQVLNKIDKKDVEHMLQFVAEEENTTLDEWTRQSTLILEDFENSTTIEYENTFEDMIQ